MIFRWRCSFCGQVIPLSSEILSKRKEGKWTLTELFCPECGEKEVVQVDDQHTIAMNTRYQNMLIRGATKAELRKSYSKLDKKRTELKALYKQVHQIAEQNLDITNTDQTESGERGNDCDERIC